MMKSTRFFMDSETHSYLLENLQDREDAVLEVGTSLCIDLVDQPFHAKYTVLEDGEEVKVYARNEMGIFEDNPDCHVVLKMATHEADTIANTGRIGNIGQVVELFYIAAKAVVTYLEDEGLTAEYTDIDFEKAGVMVTIEDDELDFEVVEGKARPDMACTMLFGGIGMMRTYMDEIMDHMGMEMLPIEEKIEMAEDGDEDMMEMLAQAYLNGDGVDQDAEKAVYWFEKLAQCENSAAQFNLGLHYAKGFGVERDYEKALYWMQQAAENGDEDAPAVAEKYAKAAEAIKKIDSGDAQAQADLAGVLMSLAGSLEQAGTLEEDYEKAFELANLSAEQNNGDGIWALALCYEHGRGVEEDVDKAIELYERGAELGHAPSQHSLACYYFRGDVLEEDFEKGFELCEKSALQGYGLAMRDMGRCYQFGNGVDDDMKKAIEWYEKALEVITDPELERKVALFKMLEEGGGFDLDYDEDEDEDYED